MVTNKLALVAFRVMGSTDRRSRATVRISRGGHDHAEAEAEGNGPMDALFRATDAALGIGGEITGLRIHAFDTYGMGGKARITVNFEGRKYGGRGSSPVRLPRGSPILTPKARAPFAIIEQVRSLLGHCMSLTGTGPSEMRAQASHGRRRESCFGVSGWAIEQTEKLAADGGGEVAETPSEVAEWCDIVINTLPGPTEVEVVVSGADGLLEGIRKSSLVVDMSTSSPSRDWLSKLQDRRRP